MAFFPPKRSWVRFVKRALSQAQAAGHDYVGPEHLLAAILDTDQPTPVSTAMASLGVTHGAYAEKICNRQSLISKPELGGLMNPAAYLVLGRAEGLAIADDAERIEDHHVLLAIAYDSLASASELAGFARADPSSVIRALAEQGVQVPDVPPPPRRRFGPMGPTIYYDRRDHAAVYATVRDAFSKQDAFWGFRRSRWRPDQNLVDAETRLDLPGLLRSAHPDVSFEEVKTSIAYEHERAAEERDAALSDLCD